MSFFGTWVIEDTALAWPEFCRLLRDLQNGAIVLRAFGIIARNLAKDI
jgi:hypothetical protein